MANVQIVSFTTKQYLQKAFFGTYVLARATKYLPQYFSCWLFHRGCMVIHSLNPSGNNSVADGLGFAQCFTIEFKMSGSKVIAYFHIWVEITTFQICLSNKWWKVLIHSRFFFSICEIDFKTVLFEPQMITEWIFGWCENGVSSHIIMIGI